ncbi:MAG: hypothetical protein AAF283_03095, partial [Cyanobacteria bacterium P01_A01_bin.70]
MSGLVATLLHTMAVYGAISVWQTRRSTVTPGPISVIALPPGTEIPLASAPATPAESVSPLTAGVPTVTQPASGALTGTQRPFEPVAPTAVAPAPRPVARPTQPAVPPVSPNGPASSPAPESPATPANPPNNGPGVVPPPVPPESPGEGAPPAPVQPAGGSPPAAPGIAAAWRPEPAPGGGSVIHEIPPQLPVTWPASVTALLTNAGCASDISPGTSVTVTLWPIIEADGQISEFIPRTAENLG